MSVLSISNLLPVNSFASVQLSKSVSESGAAKGGEQSSKTSENKSFSVPAGIVLAQFSKVNFCGNYNYGSDDLSAYDDYCGPQPPQIEIEKYRISKAVDKYIEEENYLSAIKGKIKLASICKSQGKENDAFILEESIRRLYKDLPRYQRNEAKDIIRSYNHDMAEYIDEDIKRY